MSNPPRIWLEYRPVRIGWVIADKDVGKLMTATTWNACLWGGWYNCIIPAHNMVLANNLVKAFQVDVLLPVHSDESTAAFIDCFPHLKHQRWHDSIFEARHCEFADIRHAVRWIVAHQESYIRSRMSMPSWEAHDPLNPLMTLLIGRYPEPDTTIADYKGGVQNAFEAWEFAITPADEIPPSLFDNISPIALTASGLSLDHGMRGQRGLLRPGVVLGSATDFEDLVMFSNLRAAGAELIFHDQQHGTRLKPLAHAFFSKLRGRELDDTAPAYIWLRHSSVGDTWKTELDLGDLPVALIADGDTRWGDTQFEASKPHFSAWHRDVVPSYAEAEGKASVSFALPDRPFNDNDTQALGQKFAVVIDASQYGEPDAELTFETPFVPRLNEFYGRNFHYKYDAARSQLVRGDRESVAIITEVSTQRLELNAIRVLDWMKAFFALCQMEVARSKPGLHCSRLIAQLGGLQHCRVLKIRGVRALLRKYGVDESFTRAGAMETIRDIDNATGIIGFDAFKNLYIEYREEGELKPDDVFRYLLQRRVFRVGLEFIYPNCQLSSWIHLD
jgi:hypothetical protein